jgi:hypothetical protein
MIAFESVYINTVNQIVGIGDKGPVETGLLLALFCVEQSLVNMRQAVDLFSSIVSIEQIR